jgi:DNA-directed RNA polymerase subunit RPC12/RpoP
MRAANVLKRLRRRTGPLAPSRIITDSEATPQKSHRFGGGRERMNDPSDPRAKVSVNRGLDGARIMASRLRERALRDKFCRAIEGKAPKIACPYCGSHYLKKPKRGPFCCRPFGVEFRKHARATRKELAARVRQRIA